MCVLIDNVFYLAQFGDESSDIYVSLENIDNEDQIRVIIGMGNIKLKGMTVRSSGWLKKI